MPNTTRSELLEKIAHAAIDGNLGLFIGSGLPRAIFEDEPGIEPFNWEQLLKKCASNLKVSWRKHAQRGRSYPQVASSICLHLSERKGICYEDATFLLKKEIQTLTPLYPLRKAKLEFERCFESLNPKWIITTNYDTVIESILSGKSDSLSPNGPLVVSKENVPIYHLHGIRTDPNSIVITQEDYIQLFRPNQYRLQKLPLLLRESFTIFIGYSLEDFNVQTAVDWAQNVFGNKDNKDNKVDLVQLLYVEDQVPKGPVTLKNGVTVIEFNKLSSMLSELGKAVVKEKENEKEQIKKIKILISKYLKPSKEVIKGFIDNEPKRNRILNLVKKHPAELINSFLDLLHKVDEEAWKRTKPNGAFSAYNHYLNFLLDILISIDTQTPPALIGDALKNMDKISRYLGEDRGDAHVAFKTWKRRGKDIPTAVKNEIKSISRLSGNRRMEELIEMIETV